MIKKIPGPLNTRFPARLLSPYGNIVELYSRTFRALPPAALRLGTSEHLFWCCRPHKSLQTRCAGLVPKDKTAAQRLVRDHALSAQQQFVGKIAGQAMQQRCRDEKHRGPLQPPAEFLAGRAVANRYRRGRIDRAGYLGFCQRMGDQANEIVAFDPGHPLRAPKPYSNGVSIRVSSPPSVITVDPNDKATPLDRMPLLLCPGEPRSASAPRQSRTSPLRSRCSCWISIPNC
jgi:hypothetical protein